VKLIRARVTNYRSVRDSGWFDVEPAKTILVGTNEAGKTVTLKALQTVNPPAGEGEIKALRDYPRSDYSSIQRGTVRLSETPIAEAVFSVDPDLQQQLGEIDPGFANVSEVSVRRNLDNSRVIRLGVASNVPWAEIEKDLERLRAYLAKQQAPEALIRQLDATRPEGETTISASANALLDPASGDTHRQAARGDARARGVGRSAAYELVPRTSPR
jgi:energy-coupling factor transporter ATP-binding protein EcfA2